MSSNSQEEKPLQQASLMKAEKLDDGFKRFFKFGVIDNSLLILSIIGGFSIDNFIARRIGARGYGPVIGACIGNAISDGIAAGVEGVASGLGAAAGSSLPVIPILAAMFSRRPFEGRMKWLVGGFCGTLVTAAFAHEYFINGKEKETNAQATEVVKKE